MEGNESPKKLDKAETGMSARNDVSKGLQNEKLLLHAQKSTASVADLKLGLQRPD